MTDPDRNDSRPRPPKPERYISPDGKPRTDELEHKINECFAITFRGKTGEEVLNYLKSISTNRVMPPETSPHTITYMEGARWLMGIIDARIRHGKEKIP